MSQYLPVSNPNLFVVCPFVGYVVVLPMLGVDEGTSGVFLTPAGNCGGQAIDLEVYTWGWTSLTESVARNYFEKCYEGYLSNAQNMLVVWEKHIRVDATPERVMEELKVTLGDYAGNKEAYVKACLESLAEQLRHLLALRPALNAKLATRAGFWPRPED